MVGEHSQAATDRGGRDESPEQHGVGSRINRRTLLQAAAASAAATGLAGCSGDGNGGNTPTPTQGSTSTTVATSTGCEEYETLAQSDINGGATIAAGCYRIEEKHAVDSGTLTLEPGVVIEFAENTGIKIKQGGNLQSNGTADEPIFLRGQTEQRGHWRGIGFTGDGTNANSLEHTVIAHAGGELWTGDQETHAATFITKAAVDIASCTFRQNAGKALLSRHRAADLSIANSSFEGNEIPVRLNAELVGGFAATNSVSNNDDDRVTVAGNNNKDEIAVDQTWVDPGVPYHVTQNLYLVSKLTIEAGTTFDFADQRGLDVDGGHLVVAGTGDDPVGMRGDTSERGFWQGIRFRNTTAANELAHVIVKDAGGQLWHGADYSKAGVFVAGDGVTVALRNCTIANNDVCGVTATGTGYDFTVDACEFTGNVEPLRMHADLVKNVAANNAFSGNDGSFVRIGISGARSNVLRDVTWPALDVPYRLDRDLSVRADLTIEPGTTVEAEADPARSDTVTIDVPQKHGGALTADASGADEEPIVFTASRKEPGSWGGVHFSTQRDANVLSDVVVEYGGGELNNGDLESKACVVEWVYGSTASATLNQVTIRGSAKHGIYKECDSALSCSDLKFENIGGANIWDAGEEAPVSGCGSTC